MNKVDRECFLRELSEAQDAINDLFEDYSLSSPETDCDSEDCDLPEDDDTIVRLFKIYQELTQILDEHR